MSDNNVGIFMLSSRTKMLPTCLKYFNENVHNKYPIFVYHFDDIYSEEDKKIARESYGGKVEFIELDYKVPLNIAPNEIYFNRNYINYSRMYFPPTRIGYLHMCNFYTWEAFERPELQKFDYLIRFDDDSWFKGDLGFDLIERYKQEELNSDGVFCLNSYMTGKDEPVGQNRIDTREMLFRFFQYYVKSRNIDVKNEKVKKILETNDELAFHKMGWKTDFNVWKKDTFETSEWKSWVQAVKDYGGIYKHRWGDIEIQMLYSWMYFPENSGVIDLDLKAKNLYDGHLPGYAEAPKTKDVK